jgi:hypothetical protein
LNPMPISEDFKPRSIICSGVCLLAILRHYRQFPWQARSTFHENQATSPPQQEKCRTAAADITQISREMTAWGRGCNAYHGPHVVSATTPVREPHLIAIPTPLRERRQTHVRFQAWRSKDCGLHAHGAFRMDEPDDAGAVLAHAQ